MYQQTHLLRGCHLNSSSLQSGQVLVFHLRGGPPGLATSRMAMKAGLAFHSGCRAKPYLQRPLVAHFQNSKYSVETWRLKESSQNDLDSEI